MSLFEPKITSFPFGGTNGREFYDIVYFGNVFRYSGGISKELQQEYVFVFSTSLLHHPEDSNWRGKVEIDLVMDIKISIFNRTIQERAKHHVFTNEGLVLNEFVEIGVIETDTEYEYYADLKNQGFYHRGKLQYTKDIRVFLFSEIKGNSKYYDNLPISQLAPEFQIKIELDRHEERLERIYSEENSIIDFMKRTKDKQVLEFLEKMQAENKDKREKHNSEYWALHNKYIQALHNCKYHYREVD